VLFENSVLVDRSHGPPAGFLAGAQLQERPPDLRKHCILQSNRRQIQQSLRKLDGRRGGRFMSRLAINLGSPQFPQPRRCLVAMMFQQQRLSLCAKLGAQSLSPKPTRDELCAAADTMSRTARRALDAVRA
jgi:hypothetical protein